MIVLLLWLLSPLPASAQQLTATFVPQKHVYLLGEPIWFVFRVTNKGSTPFQIENSDPYGVCALGGGYWFDVPGAKTASRWRCGYGASCPGHASIRLASGATYAQRLLLNQWYVIDHPGRYRISATRNLRFSDRSTNDGYTLVDPRSRSFTSEFEITVVKGEKAEAEKAFEPFLKNLKGGSFERRIEAVETITAVAPPFLEQTLIALATGRDSFAQSRAIPALGRLNTPESKRTLAKLIEDRQEYTMWQAIDALAQTGDRNYVPLLEPLAKEPKWQNLAIPALGELGGREVVPFLAPLVHYPLGPPDQPPVQQLAMRGLANTCSHEAIPYLIQGLCNPLVHQDAVNALAQITHLVIYEKNGKRWFYTDDDKTARQMAQRWERWWELVGKRAKLYCPGNCTNRPGELP
jgi:hypothetical protein